MGANSTKTVGQDGVPSGNGGIKTAAATVLAANPRRLWWAVLNLNNAVAYVKLAAGATNANFDVALKAGAAVDDGSGGSFFDDTHTGEVSVATAGGGVRVSVIEFNAEF